MAHERMCYREGYHTIHIDIVIGFMGAVRADEHILVDDGSQFSSPS